MTHPEPQSQDVEDADRRKTAPASDPDGGAPRTGGSDTEGLEGLNTLT